VRHDAKLRYIQQLTPITGPLFDTSVVFQNVPWKPESLRIPGLDVTDVSDDYADTNGVDGQGFTHYPLRVAVVPGERLSLEVSYRRDVLDEPRAGRLARRLVRLLEAIATDPRQLAGRVDVLSDRERWLLLTEWNDAAASIPEVTLADLVEAQATATPDAVAAVCGADELTYHELNARSNRVAHRLRELGVGPDDRVAVVAERGLELIVWTIAVLKGS
jgi:non-ribosomal peptide synthetase component F